MSSRWLLPATAAVCLASCAPKTDPPAGQIVLFFDTDAPVTPANGPSGSATEPIPLFDRLRIEATTPDGGACNECSREFDVTEEMFLTQSVSLGVLSTFSGGSIRARLFRSNGTLTGEPDPDSTIDVTASLPPIEATGVTAMTLLLPTDATGTPTSGSLTTDGPGGDGGGRSQVGSWPGAKREACPSAPKPGEVCVPGGAYWMGNPRAFYGFPLDGNRQRIAVMSPFFIDAAEVTVAAYRRSGLAPGGAWTGVETGQLQDYCTYTPSPGPFDAYPINCISWQEARAYCQSQGEDLPTEAQYEYVASDLSGELYPWGSDVPACTDAVLARAGVGGFLNFFGACRTTKWGGCEVPGSGARDRVDLPTGTVVDLAGNLGEPTLDRWAALTDPCWSRPGVYEEPFCGPASPCSATDNLVTARGGTWADSAFTATAALRSETDCSVVTPLLGVRCARPAKE